MVEPHSFPLEIIVLRDMIVESLAQNSAVFPNGLDSWVEHRSQHSTIYSELSGTISRYDLKVRMLDDGIMIHIDRGLRDRTFIALEIRIEGSRYPSLMQGVGIKSLDMLDDPVVFNALVVLNILLKGRLEEAARQFARVQDLYPDTDSAMFKFASKFLLKLKQHLSGT